MKTAVALKYSTELPAPVIVGKGKQAMARRLIDVARDLGIPVVEERGLAEMLVEFDTGDYIPEEVYEVVANILIFIQQVDL